MSVFVPHGTVSGFHGSCFVVVFMLSFPIKTMDTYHAAFWSDPCFTSSEEEISRDSRPVENKF